MLAVCRASGPFMRVSESLWELDERYPGRCSSHGVQHSVFRTSESEVSSGGYSKLPNQKTADGIANIDSQDREEEGPG